MLHDQARTINGVIDGNRYEGSANGPPPTEGAKGPQFRGMVDGQIVVTKPVSPDRDSYQWWARADELAEWAMDHLVNRQDAFGHYNRFETRGKKGENGRPDSAFCDKRPVTLSAIADHFRGLNESDVIGHYSTYRDEAGECWCRTGSIDIDRHGDDGDPGVNRRYALALYDRARAMGFSPLLEDSNGTGGFHLILLFDAPVRSERVFALLKGLTHDWKENGLGEEPETFPKQARLKGQYGNFLRTFGRHHTRLFWSKFWDGSRWLAGDEAIDLILKTEPSPGSIIPPEPEAPGVGGKRREARPVRKSPGREALTDAELARDALGRLDSMRDGYDDWLHVGMALHSLGSEGLALWDEWSRGSPKYQPGACEAKWASFTVGVGGVTLGSLFHWAKQAGWERPKGPTTRGSDSSDEPDAGWSINDRRTICRISAALRAVPPAVSGQGGRERTLEAAYLLVHGYDLTPDQARPFIVTWNAGCMPPWTPADLAEILDRANAAEDPEGRARGYLRDSEPPPKDQAGPGPRQDAEPDAPERYSELDPEYWGLSSIGELWPPVAYGESMQPQRQSRWYLGRHHGFPGPDRRTLVHWQGSFYQHNGASWYEVADAEFRASLTEFMTDDFEEIDRRAWEKHEENGETDPKKNPLPKPISITNQNVSAVTTCITSKVVKRKNDYPGLPAWIGPGPGWDPRDVLATPTQLVNIPMAARKEAGAVVPSTPAFFNLSHIAFDYDPDAPEPVEWLKFGGSIFAHDPVLFDLLQEWFGYLLTSDTSQQKIALLIGPPRSGKGTVARVITEVLGAANVVNPKLGSLGERFGLAPLVGKPVAIVTDAKVGTKDDRPAIGEALLSISGEDGQTIDRKNKEALTVTLPTRFMLLANMTPDLKEESGALANRLLPMELKQSFLHREDLGLLGRLLGEMPGILNWAIAGAARLKDRGRFDPPQSSRDAVRDIAKEASPVLAFAAECCVLDADATVAKADLFESWKVYAAARNFKVGSTPEGFFKLFKAAVRGVVESRPRVGGERIQSYTGVRLRPEASFSRPLSPPAAWLRGMLDRGSCPQGHAIEKAKDRGFTAAEVFAAAEELGAISGIDHAGKKTWELSEVPF